MVVIQCKDGELNVGDWMLNKILCRDFLACCKKWIATHTTKEVLNELLDLANK